MMTKVSRMLGNPFTASVIRITISSRRPPKYPVTAPRRIPMVPENSTTRKLMASVVLQPFMTLEKISLPKLSVPNKYWKDGAANFSAADMAVVLYGVQKRPVMPISTARPVITAPTVRYPFQILRKAFLFVVSFFIS